MSICASCGADFNELRQMLRVEIAGPAHLRAQRLIDRLFDEVRIYQMENAVLRLGLEQAKMTQETEAPASRPWRLPANVISIERNPVGAPRDARSRCSRVEAALNMTPGMTSGEIARATGLSTRNASEALNALGAGDRVYRQPLPLDRPGRRSRYLWYPGPPREPAVAPDECRTAILRALSETRGRQVTKFELSQRPDLSGWTNRTLLYTLKALGDGGLITRSGMKTNSFYALTERGAETIAS